MNRQLTPLEILDYLDDIRCECADIGNTGHARVLTDIIEQLKEDWGIK